MPSTSSARRPAVVALDTLQTLVSLDPVADVLEHHGLPDEALDLFFGRVLRDLFALELGGVYRPFEEVALAALDATLEALEHDRDPELESRVLSCFADLPVHSDAKPALERLRSEDVRVVLLTNGTREATESVIRKAGLGGLVENVLSAEESRHYKPAREAYLHAARALETVPGHITLVAAHSWDVQGAKQAGLGAAWVRRHEHEPNPTMTPPDLRGDDLFAIADALASRPVHA